MPDTLAIDQLKPNPSNPRFEVGNVDELAESIGRHGIVEPIVVSPDGAKFVVVCGHRRVKAAKLAGLARVPVVVRQTEPAERELIALTENVHRKQMSPVEEAVAYARLMKTRGLTQRAVARMMDVSEATVSLRMALLRCDKATIDAVHAGRVSADEAIGLERRQRRARGKMPAKFNAGRKSKCKLEGHDECDGRTCEVRKLQRRGAAA